jgi:hypothetical protein
MDEFETSDTPEPVADSLVPETGNLLEVDETNDQSFTVQEDPDLLAGLDADDVSPLNSTRWSPEQAAQDATVDAAHPGAADRAALVDADNPPADDLVSVPSQRKPPETLASSEPARDAVPAGDLEPPPLDGKAAPKYGEPSKDWRPGGPEQH